MRAIFTTTLLVIVFCTTGYAEQNAPQALLGGNSDILASSFRVVWGLLIVLGIILILYGLLRKRFSLFASMPNKEIKVVEIKPLMGKKAICLVEVRGTEYLIGISESQISNIATLPPKKGPSFRDTLRAESGETDE